MGCPNPTCSPTHPGSLNNLRAHPSNKDLGRIRHRLVKEINTRELELHRLKADRFPTEMIHRFEVGVWLLRVPGCPSIYPRWARQEKSGDRMGAWAGLTGAHARVPTVSP